MILIMSMKKMKKKKKIKLGDLAGGHVGLIVGPASDALIGEVATFADKIVVVEHPLLDAYHRDRKSVV